jgi:hypothetical protein
MTWRTLSISPYFAAAVAEDAARAMRVMSTEFTAATAAAVARAVRVNSTLVM